MDKKTKRTATVKRLPHSEVEIESELSAEEVLKHRTHALKHLNEDTKLDGFRTGHIPEKVLIERVGELAILEEATRHALADAYPEILEAEKIDAVGRPEITLTKIAPNQPVSFKIKTAIVPEVKTPDYIAIAKKFNATPISEPAISEKEINEAIARIRAQYSEAKKEQSAPTTAVVEKKDSAITDEEVKLWGDFSSADDFTMKLTGALLDDKRREAKEKRRISLIDAILEKTEMDLPTLVVEHEIDVLLARLEGDLKSMGTTVAEYAKNAKKSEAEIKESMRPAAEKKAKLQLTLNEIAKREKITIKTEDLEKEVSHLLAHYPDADKENVRLYAVSVLGNEKVFEFLENQKETA